jgi:RNA polymerase primary sigma factor
MASNVSQKAEKLGTESPGTPSDRPLLDLSDAAVKALIRTAKRRGYVTAKAIRKLKHPSRSRELRSFLND